MRPMWCPSFQKNGPQRSFSSWTPKTARTCCSLLRYPEGSAGALMGTELIRVELDWTVSHAIREMRRQAEDVETVHSVYVVNACGQLLGTACP